MSENISLSLFLLAHISKNRGTTELLFIYVYYVIYQKCGFTSTAISETMRDVLEVIWSVFTLASIANTQRERERGREREYV